MWVQIEKKKTTAQGSNIDHGYTYMSLPTMIILKYWIISMWLQIEKKGMLMVQILIMHTAIYIPHTRIIKKKYSIVAELGIEPTISDPQKIQERSLSSLGHHARYISSMKYFVFEVRAISA